MSTSRLPFRWQQRDYWCGPACVQMMFAMNGKRSTQAAIARRMKTNKLLGTLRVMLLKELRQLGSHVHVVRHGTLEQLRNAVPAIVSYQEVGGEDHYAIVIAVLEGQVVMHDPWHGANYRLSHKEFIHRWNNPKLRKKYTGWFVSLDI